MSDSDLRGRFPRPRIALERRPLSNSASTASCSMRFSLRRMTSGARCRISFCNRLFRLITRRYRSFKSDVAKRPPSSGTRGRRSGGMTGTTSRIIQRGSLRCSPALPELRIASTILSRFSICFLRCWLVSFATVSRNSSASLSTLIRSSSKRIAGDPMSALNAVSPSVLAEQLPLLYFLLARLDHHVIRVVDDALEVAQRHVEQVTHRRRQRLEEPDVRDRHGELDVAHALAPHLRQRHLDAAAVADHAAIADPLVLPAVALPV